MHILFKFNFNLKLDLFQAKVSLWLPELLLLSNILPAFSTFSRKLPWIHSTISQACLALQ